MDLYTQASLGVYTKAGTYLAFLHCQQQPLAAVNLPKQHDHLRPMRQAAHAVVELDLQRCRTDEAGQGRAWVKPITRPDKAWVHDFWVKPLAWPGLVPSLLHAS